MTPAEFATVTDWLPFVAVLGISFGTRTSTKRLCAGLLLAWVIAIVVVICVEARP